MAAPRPVKEVAVLRKVNQRLVSPLVVVALEDAVSSPGTIIRGRDICGTGGGISEAADAACFREALECRE